MSAFIFFSPPQAERCADAGHESGEEIGGTLGDLVNGTFLMKHHILPVHVRVPGLVLGCEECATANLRYTAVCYLFVYVRDLPVLSGFRRSFQSVGVKQLESCSDWTTD